MNDRSLLMQLRWCCDLAAAMGQTEVPVSALRDLLNQAERHVAVPDTAVVSLAAFRDKKEER